MRARAVLACRTEHPQPDLRCLCGQPYPATAKWTFPAALRAVFAATFGHLPRYPVRLRKSSILHLRAADTDSAGNLGFPRQESRAARRCERIARGWPEADLQTHDVLHSGQAPAIERGPARQSESHALAMVLV